MAATKDPRTRLDWGTIVQPPFELGFQKLETGQVAEIVDRLHTTETKARVAHKNIPEGNRPGPAREPSEVAAIVERLSTVTKPPPESKRIGALQDPGILNSYAWKGWKSSDTIHQ